MSNGGMCSAFLQEFRNWESAWALDALYVIAYEIRVLAEKVTTTSPSIKVSEPVLLG